MDRLGSITASAYTVPTDCPEADGTLAWDSTTLVLVEVTAGGVTGIGYTYAPAAAVTIVRDVLEPAVAECPDTAPVTAWTSMCRAVRNAGRQGLVGMALSAVDIALWDLAGRLHDLPLAVLWGHAPKPVPAYGSGGFTSYDDQRLRSQLEQWARLGLASAKIKIGQDRGHDVRRDLERAGLAREAAGDMELFVDANGAYGANQAIRVGRQLDELGVTWFEEPVTSDDLEGLRRVRDHVLADVTAGEYGWDLDYFGHMAPVVDCLQVDVTRCGGYTEWFRIAARAQSQHVQVSGHCAPYLTLPAAAATPSFRHQEWFHDHVRIEQALFDGTPDPVDGALVAPDAPGHGLTFKPEDAERFRVA